MKKVLAVVLSLVMLFAVCVPAFAAGNTVITDKNPAPVDGKQTADTVLKTFARQEDATYRVSIPTEVVIPWESLKTVMQYSIETQLALGKRLRVDVQSTNGVNEMTYAGKDDKIPYSFSPVDGGPEVEMLSFTTDDEVFTTIRYFNIDIATESWKSVPVAEYTDTLTFTVEIVDA